MSDEEEHYIIPGNLPLQPTTVPLVSYVGEQGRQVIGEAKINADGTCEMKLTTDGSRLISEEYYTGDLCVGFVAKSVRRRGGYGKLPSFEREPYVRLNEIAPFAIERELLEPVEPSIMELIDKESWGRFNDDAAQA